MSQHQPPKLYLDEHLSPRLVTELERYGFDVETTQNSGMLSKKDADQLAYAALNERALVTINFSDFTSLHSDYFTQGIEHWGIILSTQEEFSVLLRRLLRLLNSLSAIELKNQIRWLNEFK